MISQWALLSLWTKVDPLDSRLTAPVPQPTGEVLVISECRGALNFSLEKEDTVTISIALPANIDIRKRQPLGMV